MTRHIRRSTGGIADDITVLARANALIALARKTADALEARVWQRLAARGWEAVNLALLAVLQSRLVRVPRTTRARMDRLEALGELDEDLRAFHLGVLVAHSELRVLAVERNELAATAIQNQLRSVEDEMLPLARRLCGIDRRRRGA